MGRPSINGDDGGRARFSRATQLAKVLVLAIFAAGCDPVQPSPVASGPSAGTPGPSTAASPAGSPNLPGTPAPVPSAAPVGEGPIVDDPGAVPEALRDRYIVLNGVVGQLGAEFTVQLPEGEMALGFGAGVIATVLTDPETHEPIWRGSGVLVTIRDLATLGELRSFETPVFITESLVVGTRLLWIGLDREPGTTEDDPIDAGLYAFDLEDLNSEPVVLQERRNLADEFGAFASRGVLRQAQRGAAITTVIQGEERLVTEVFDLDTLETTTIETGNEVALAVLDGRVLLVVPHEYAETTQTLRLAEYPSLEARSEPIDIEMAQNSVVIGDQEVYVLVGIEGRQRIVALRLEDGERTDVREFDPDAGESYFLDPYLSTGAVLALTPAEGPEPDDQGRLATPVALLDPREGTLEPAVFTIRVP